MQGNFRFVVLDIRLNNFAIHFGQVNFVGSKTTQVAFIPDLCLSVICTFS